MLGGRITGGGAALVACFAAAATITAAGVGTAATAARTSTSVDAVAKAQLIVQGTAATGPIGSAITAVPRLSAGGGPALVVAAPFANLTDRAQAGEVLCCWPPAAGTVTLGDPSLPGFRIIGGPYYRAGTEVESAGDVNGDGRGDILLTAPRLGVSCPTPRSGPCGYKTPAVAFVVYGKTDTATVDLAHLKSLQGFEIRGVQGGPGTGVGIVAGLPHFTGTRYGAIAVDGQRYGKLHYAGGTYVIYGGAHPTTVDLQHVGSRGFRVMAGAQAYEKTESMTVTDAGSVTGNGRAALLLDAPGPKATSLAVLFGRRYKATVSIDHLGRDGFKIRGAAVVGGALPVAPAGDVNADGKGDILVTRGLMGPGGLVAPEADIVYGSATTTTVDLAHPGARVTRMAAGDVPPGHDLQVGPLAGLGDLNRNGTRTSRSAPRRSPSTPAAPAPTKAPSV